VRPLQAAPVPVVPAVGAARPGGRRDVAMAAGHASRQGACTGGSRLWLPDL